MQQRYDINTTYTSVIKFQIYDLGLQHGLYSDFLLKAIISSQNLTLSKQNTKQYNEQPKFKMSFSLYTNIPIVFFIFKTLCLLFALHVINLNLVMISERYNLLKGFAELYFLLVFFLVSLATATVYLENKIIYHLQNVHLFSNISQPNILTKGQSKKITYFIQYVIFVIPV